VFKMKTELKFMRLDFKVLLIILMLSLCSMLVFSSNCQTNQPIGSPCFDTVRLLKSCTYVDIYKNNVFYDQYLLTYTKGFYYYDYSININETGSYVLRFCDDQTYSFINMYIDNGTNSDIANITLIYPAKDVIINTNNPEFEYTMSNNLINESNFLYTEVYLMQNGNLYRTAIDNTSINDKITISNIDNGYYQYYIVVFYTGGNITSQTQSFRAVFTTDAQAFTDFHPLTFDESIFCIVLFIGYLGILTIGLIFSNPAFQVLSLIIGIGLGVFLLRVNMLLGIVFILANLIGSFITVLGKR